MKLKIALISLLCLLCSAANAQNAKNVLEIDQSSFRPVQTDVLKGVAIDKIGVDRSKRPCARIKMHVNRMTREEIDQIAVKTVGGMVELTKRITAAEGNGLVFEVTAKPDTRFYIHHDKYGDSNEVVVNLEGNKEYRIDAQLNMLLSITVASNTNDAEVYIDEVFKGRTANGSVLTVEDVTPGSHTLKLKYGSSVKEQRINVNSSSIFFRQEVDIEGMRPQYVVFNLEPKYATVFIDNEPQLTQEGCAVAILPNGTYNYRVFAKGYFEQSGSFTVSGAKVTHDISLKADAAMVTITSGEGAEIWVNNELKGVSPWRGQLFSGTYIFEARKAGHRTTTISQSVGSMPIEQSYTIEAPKPIIGSVDITSVPAIAEVYIDGKKVGQSPLFLDLLEGKHAISIVKEGYKTYKEFATVLDGKTTTIVAMMEKGVDEASSASTTSNAVTATSTTSSTTPKFSMAVTTQSTPFKLNVTDKKSLSPKEQEHRHAQKVVSAHRVSYYSRKWCPSRDSLYKAVRNYNKLWGVRSISSEEVLPYEYNRLFVDDYIYARKDKKSTWGVYDKSGKLIIPHIYDDIKNFSNEGLWAVRKGSKWGYVDSKGNVVIDFVYNDAKLFSEGLAAVKKGGKYGYIDKSGKVVLPFKHKDADGFYNGLARVGKQAGYGWISYILLGVPGWVCIPLVMSNDFKYGYIDKSGGLVVPKEYKTASLIFDENGVAGIGRRSYDIQYYIDRNFNKYNSKAEAYKALGVVK